MVKHGFGAMDPDRRREAASKGGRNAHANGRAYEFDSDAGREAGRRGGQSVSRDREHMAEIGRRGGKAKKKRRRARSASSASASLSVPHGASAQQRKPLSE